MSGEIQVTVVGNLTANPELRFTQNGIPVAGFTVASTPRRFVGGEWVDGEAVFLRCTAWRDLGEHVAGSLHKGDRVIVSGRVVQRSYEAREGEKRSSTEIEVDEVGPSLRYATATVVRVGRRTGPAPDVDGEAWVPSSDEVPF